MRLGAGTTNYTMSNFVGEQARAAVLPSPPVPAPVRDVSFASHIRTPGSDLFTH